jgi:uncharacterized protein YdhG (YjbR/CyaY superfamily)
MIKLIDILKKIHINEDIVKVPQEVLSKSKEIYNYISKNLEKLKSESNGLDYNHPYIDPKFKNYLKLKDLKNQDLLITIGFYNDPKDAGAARMDTQADVFLINLAYPIEYEDFKETIEHELVHAVDPKLRNNNVYQRIAKKGAEPSGNKFARSIDKSNLGAIKSEFIKNYEKYIKSPWEFDAFTASLVNKVATNIKKHPNYRNLLNNLLSDIKSKDIKSILADKKYEQMPWFFSNAEWISENYPKIEQEYESELMKMKMWSTKPTLYKRFVKRLGVNL